MITEIYHTKLTNDDSILTLMNDGENLLLREKLNLPPIKVKSGQEKLFRFRQMTQEEANTYKTLFPIETAIEKYVSYIPTDVLQALDEFLETCPYKICGSPQIWHAKDYDPDPVLVVPCRTEDDGYNFADTKFLVARWGDALVPFAELCQRAFVKWRNKRLLDLQTLQEELNVAIRKTESTTEILKLDSPYWNF